MPLVDWQPLSEADGRIVQHAVDRAGRRRGDGRLCGLDAGLQSVGLFGEVYCRRCWGLVAVPATKAGEP